MVRRSHQFPGALAAALAGFLLLGGWNPIQAQYAVGDGHALDRNLQTGGSRYNPDRPGFLLNRINESIITGHAPGGLGFRGDVGYGAAFDFRGSLPSDALYRFQRDAYSFSIGRRNYGFAQVPSGAGATMPEYSASLTRPGGGVSLAQLARWRYGTESVILNPDNSLGVAAQRRHAAIREEGADPVVVEESSARVSPRIRPRRTLTGSDPLLDWSPLQQVWNPLPETDLPSTAVAGIESWRQPAVPRLIHESDSESEEEETPTILHAGEDIYSDLLLRMNSLATGRENPEFGSTYNPEDLSALDSIRENLKAMRWSEIVPGDPRDPGTEGAARAQWPMTASGRLDPLSRLAGSTVTPLNQYLRSGETALSQGRYFEAERWFALARTVEADNPLGLIGQIHSEIGAGLYRSASRHLRTLLAAHPEVIGWSYADRLLPTEDRFQAALPRLTAALDDADWRDAGLLLAYIGHITDDTSLIAQGLEDMNATGVLADPIRAMTRRMWMPELPEPGTPEEEPPN